MSSGSLFTLTCGNSTLVMQNYPEHSKINFPPHHRKTAIVIGQKINGINERRGDLGQILEGNSLLRRWWNPSTGCPEQLWKPHPWRHSRPGWLGPWAAWAGGDNPPMARDWSWVGFKDHSNPIQPVISWSEHLGPTNENSLTVLWAEMGCYVSRVKEKIFTTKYMF